VRSLFIYWKLDPALAGAALQAARRWQADLRARHPGLQTGLYRRSDESARAEGAVTVMETYASAPGIDGPLAAAIDAAGVAGLAPLGAPRRHVEVFDAVDG
jgi:hypothetical protein